MNNYITQLTDAKPGWRYGSDEAIYTERFFDGRLLCAAYQDNGIPIHARDEQLDRSAWDMIPDKPAFDLVLDGESLYFGWEIESFATVSQKDGTVCGTLMLRHTWKPVSLAVITSACGHGFFRRTIKITNTSTEKHLGLTAITPLSGLLWAMSDKLRENLHDRGMPPYSVGHFKDLVWGSEGNFEWQDLPLNTEVSFACTLGHSGHPFFILRNNLYGGYFVGQLGWSANWRTRFLSSYEANVGEVKLMFEVMPTAPAPMRMIAPGETIAAPEVHFGISHEDFDAAIQRLHSYQRASVLRKVGNGLQPVIYNHWGYMGHELSEEKLIQEIDIAAEIGAELFMVDAGWYGNKLGSWSETTGNWFAGDRLPHDLFPVFEHAKKMGLKYGLWVEIESAGRESKLAAEHPDWFISRYGKPVDRILDLAKPAVKAYVESEIIRIIERYQLDMFRLDYNINAMEGGFNLVGECQENTLWRHVEAIYEIFDRVGLRFPNLQLENCAQGGARTDVGIVSRFTTTWISDWMKLPRTVRILNGMSMVFPPEYVSRMFGAAMAGSYQGNPDTLMHVILLAHPTISGLTPGLTEANPALYQCVKKYIGIYKNFIRTFHRQARVYHHTPVIPGADGTGWCALEYVSADRKQAVAGIFRLANATEEVYRMKFRGLNPEWNYRLTREPDGHSMIVSGFVLGHDGIEVRLDAALTSRLMLLVAQ